MLEIRTHDTAKSANRKVEWLTPRYIIDALGPFDLDPCAPTADKRPWPTAAKHYTTADNGLMHPWFGRVWLNPPYSAGIVHWVRRLADHGNGIALVFARTETGWFHEAVWGRASGVYFLEGRLTFCHADGTPGPGNSGAPSCLVAYGENNVDKILGSGIRGVFVREAVA